MIACNIRPSIQEVKRKKLGRSDSNPARLSHPEATHILQAKQLCLFAAKLLKFRPPFSSLRKVLYN
jgi:hypothetical protein